MFTWGEALRTLCRMSLQAIAGQLPRPERPSTAAAWCSQVQLLDLLIASEYWPLVEF